MKLILTGEQKELASSVARFLADTSPISRVREIAESPQGHDAAVWTRLSTELGLPALAIPEAYGGAGYGRTEVCVVMEALGAALTPTPYFASAVLAAEALLHLGDEDAAKELLPGIASGSTIATLALPEPSTAPPLARPTADGHELSGHAPRVLHGMDADITLITAVPGPGRPPAVFAVSADAPGLTRTPLTTLDLTRPRARLDFQGTPARLIGPADATEPLARVQDLASVALAAEQLGGMRHCLNAIVDYAKLRVQFGRFIGSFQGVKHKLADMHCTLEQAESIARYASWTADESPEELPVAAALAQSFLGPAYFQVAKDHLLLHGGIGFTWEHDAHLYYKRAEDDHLFFGAPHRHRTLLAERLHL